MIHGLNVLIKYYLGIWICRVHYRKSGIKYAQIVSNTITGPDKGIDYRKAIKFAGKYFKR